jgi:hypothetical protein
MDYISRDDVFRKLIEGDGDDEFTEGYNFAVNEHREKIKAMPAVDVQPVRHGRWENEYLDDDDVWWADCTNCNNDTHSRFGRVSIYAYCPNCGARMDVND